MIISITLPDPTSNSNPKLPPTLAKISHDEIVLIELQGALDVGDMHPSERNGKFVGKLSVDDGLVSPFHSFERMYNNVYCVVSLLSVCLSVY